VKKRLIPLAVVFSALVLLGACSDDDEPEQTTTDDAAEETTDDSADQATGDDASGDAAADAAAGAPVTTAESSAGEILVDAEGLSLYGFTQDTDGTPTCSEACADAWPPLTVDGPDLPEGLDPAVYSVVEAADGSFQLVAGDWPLYRFAGDSAAGDVNGQGSGGVWFLVAPDGSLLQGDDGAEAEPASTDEAPTGY
jgi:predicted lipoprotein with Yx(FWY)xxD motif